MSEALAPGATFGGYRVESQIGRGGMGVVYRATDLSLERPVALKLIAPDLAEDVSFRERFLREPRLAASLDHPNVIPIYEAGERDGQLYLAMRYVEGSDLKTIIEREGKLEPERALRIVAQVAAALDAAHRRALVHRDVKPANVLVDEDGHVYLTDFGITKQLGGDSTDTGRVVGTLDYLAPEQIRGDPVDARTDVYALACVLYQCLSGTAAVSPRDRGRDDVGAHAGAAGSAARPPEARSGAAKGARQGPRRALRELRRADRRGGRGARPGEPARAAFAPPVLVRHRRAIFVAGLRPARRIDHRGRARAHAAATAKRSRSPTASRRSIPRRAASPRSPSPTTRPGQRRRRGGRRLGAEQQGRERLAHRPRDEGDRQDVQARRPPERDRRRRGGGMGRERRRVADQRPTPWSASRGSIPARRGSREP